MILSGKDLYQTIDIDPDNDGNNQNPLIICHFIRVNKTLLFLLHTKCYSVNKVTKYNNIFSIFL